MEPVTTAALISGGTKLLSGFLDKGPKKGPSADDLKVMERQSIMNRTKAYKDAGAKHGFHPLALMGNIPTSSYSSYLPDQGRKFSKSADLVSDLGQGVARAVAVGKNSAQRRLDDLAIENAELSNDYLQVQIAGAQRALTNQALPPPVEIIPDLQTAGRSGDTGKTAGDHPAFKSWDMGKGREMELPWSDEGIAESMEGLPWPYAYAKMVELLFKRKADKFWWSKHKKSKPSKRFKKYKKYHPAYQPKKATGGSW